MDTRSNEPIVYELWSEDDLRWIEIPTPTVELAVFLEAWCEKNGSIFRRRPFGTRKVRPNGRDPVRFAEDPKTGLG